MPDSVIDRLNQRMAEIYGHRWTSAYTRESLDTWAKGLAGLTVDQIRHGVESCIAGAFAWPPTLPEFRALCVAIPGLPSADDAWAEAFQIARRWKRPHECSHPAVYHALSQVVNYNFIEEESLHKRFIRNYERVCDELSKGAELSAIPQPLPRPEDVKTNYPEHVRRAAADEALKKINAMLGRPS